MSEMSDLETELYDRAMGGDSMAAVAYAILNLAKHDAPEKRSSAAGGIREDKFDSCQISSGDMRAFIADLKLNRELPFTIAAAELRALFSAFTGTPEDDLEPTLFGRVLMHIDSTVTKIRPWVNGERPRYYRFSEPQSNQHLL